MVHGKGLDVGSEVVGKCAVDMVPKVWDYHNVSFFMLYHTYLRTYPYKIK